MTQYTRDLPEEASVATLATRTGYAARSGTITRPNNTTGYTAHDVIGTFDQTTGANATAGRATIQFIFTGMPVAGVNGAEFMITSTEFERNVTALISGETSYTLYLFGAAPASALADNAAFDLVTTDLNFLGKVGLGTPVDEVSTLYIRQDGVDAQITIPAGQNFVYGYIVTEGAYTPAASTTHYCNLHGILI